MFVHIFWNPEHPKSRHLVLLSNGLLLLNYRLTTLIYRPVKLVGSMKARPRLGTSVPPYSRTAFFYLPVLFRFWRKWRGQLRVGFFLPFVRPLLGSTVMFFLEPNRLKNVKNIRFVLMITVGLHHHGRYIFKNKVTK